MKNAPDFSGDWLEILQVCPCKIGVYYKKDAHNISNAGPIEELALALFENLLIKSKFPIKTHFSLRNYEIGFVNKYLSLQSLPGFSQYLSNAIINKPIKNIM